MNTALFAAYILLINAIILLIGEYGKNSAICRV